jgi:hypothetical protein
MKKLPTQLAVLALAIQTTMLAAAPAYAFGGDYTVYPSYTHNGNKSWIITDIAGGRTTTEFINLENLSDKNETVKLEFLEATNTDNKFIPVESAKYKNLGTWITMEINTYTLAPRQKIQVPVTISVPEKTTIGEYDGVIYANREEISAQNIRLVTRLGIRMYINVTSGNVLGADIFNSTGYKGALFLTLSSVALAGSLFYNVIHYLENKKYGTHHA